MATGYANTISRSAKDRWACIGLFCGLLLVYHANIDLTFAPDSKSNSLLAVSIINDHDMSFTPAEAPLLFFWSVADGGNSEAINGDLAVIDGTIEKLIEKEEVVALGPRYLAVPTVHAGVYVSTFNPGSAILAVPFFALLSACLGNLVEHPIALWYGGKFFAAACVAGSAAFVFQSVRSFESRCAAIVIALAYGLGTAVWSTSSQGLWQHGPVELLLAAGAFLLVDTVENLNGWKAAVVGVLFGFATLCRPTIGIVVIAVGIHFLATSRRALICYVLGGLPLALFLVAYNTYYFGSPIAFGETLVTDHAIEKTGAPDFFPTPLWAGALVSLISPSRGLFVFSPFLLLSVPGAIAVLRVHRYRAWRALTIAVVGIWLVQFAYFDYWGGYCYGNRNLVDTTPLLALFLTPMWQTLIQTPLRKIVFAAAIIWSIGVQALGAFAFDSDGWNGRIAYEVALPDREIPQQVFDPAEAEALSAKPGATCRQVVCDIDKPEYRYRFWSWSDNQILYYVTHLSLSVQRRRGLSRLFDKPWSQQVAQSHALIGDAFLRLGNPSAAAIRYADARRLDPENREYLPQYQEAVHQAGKRRDHRDK